MVRHSFVLLILTVALLSCKHKLPEPAPPKNNGTTTGNPTPQPQNPKDSVCFGEEILPLLVSNCAKSGCHNEQGHQANIILSSYTNVKSSVSGQLLVKVLEDTGPLRMPPEPHDRLSDTQITLVKKWIGEGMKDGIDCEGPCDTVNVQFSTSVMPIITNNCIGCHSNTAPVFTGYTGLRPLALDGRLMQAITHTASDPNKWMPQGGPKLSDCKIRIIAKWVESGALDN